MVFRVLLVVLPNSIVRPCLACMLFGWCLPTLIAVNAAMWCGPEGYELMCSCKDCQSVTWHGLQPACKHRSHRSMLVKRDGSGSTDGQAVQVWGKHTTRDCKGNLHIVLVTQTLFELWQRASGQQECTPIAPPATCAVQQAAHSLTPHQKLCEYCHRVL